MSVVMKPGATALTVMFREASSRATVRVNPITPGLARRVVRLTRVAHQARHAGDVDDPAVPLPHHHRRRRGLTEEERAL